MRVSSTHVNVLEELKLPYILAIGTGHALWLPQDKEVVQQPWQRLERSFSNGTIEVRYMAQVIYGIADIPFARITNEPDDFGKEEYIVLQL